jgi:3-hydroxyacyl-CoA dehydrogenase
LTSGCSTSHPLSLAEKALDRAVNTARTNAVRLHALIGTLQDDLQLAISKADLIIETLAEDFALKDHYLKLVDQYRKPGAVVGTCSSGLSVTALARGKSDDFRKHFLGIHFYNPPIHLPALELIPNPDTLPPVVDWVGELMHRRFRRVVVKASDTPGYAGNRIGMKVINEAVQLVPQYGVAIIDYLLGGYTGRVMPPLETVDLVGWDVHKAVVDNLHTATKDEANDAFVIPAYFEERLRAGALGNKTPDKGGFYKTVDGKRHVLNIKTGQYAEHKQPRVSVIEKVKSLIRFGEYAQALQTPMRAPEPEAAVSRRWLLGYISYAGMRNDDVSDMQGINRVMAFGFNWAPPDVLADFIGSSETVALLRQEGLAVPPHLASWRAGKLYQEDDDPGRYLIAR